MRERGFVAAVDAFMPMPKLLAGAELPSWHRGRDNGPLSLKLPIEVAGEQRGEQLLINAYPEHHSLMFSIGIICHMKVVCRLDFQYDVIHGNKARYGRNNAVIRGPHWHPWELNRAFASSIFQHDELPNAVPFTEAHQFDAALRWYCGKRNIDLGFHGIIYPARERLI